MIHGPSNVMYEDLYLRTAVRLFKAECKQGWNAIVLPTSFQLSRNKHMHNWTANVPCWTVAFLNDRLLVEKQSEL